MKTLEYKIKCIRMNDKTWELLKQERKKRNLSWNLFLLELIGKKKPVHNSHHITSK